MILKINWLGHGIINSSTFKDLHTQIQGLSRTTSVFKDFSGLENEGKKFKDFQGLARARLINARKLFTELVK